MRKKNDNGLKAIICLAVATLAIGGASVALSLMEKPVNSGTNGGNEQGSNGTSGTELTVSGDTKVQSATLNDDGTFTLVIKETGYVGEMTIEAVYSADGKTLISYDVLSHTETDGIGSKLDEDAYKAVLANVKLPIAANGMDISGILGIEAEAPESAGTTGTLKDGTYTAQATPDDKGNYAFVTLTVEGGKVVSVTWDEVYNGSLKSILSTTGQYVMKPVWQTQSESVGAYVVENQGTAGIMNENGYTDVVSGVSINIAGAVGLIDQAIAQANGKDGVYEVKADADDKGNYAFVTLTIEGGKITSVVWDEVYNGSLKSVLSTTGQYVMKPVWQTQSESMCAYVVENQGTAGLNLNDSGKTDVVSGVSISVNGFTALVDDCLAQASGTGLKDGVYAVKADADDKGNYAFVTVTIEGGKITSVVWDEVYNGSLKSVLSTTGQYVMKPVWQTQSESMCAYVVENQGTAGLNLNDSGKTDVVSGVSISVNGFTALVDKAIAEAAGKDGVYEVKADADDKGNYAFVTLTIEGGKITSVTWDEVYNGSLKSVLSTTGQYVMKPVWQTQSESVGAYVVENQTTAGIMNENGYTDVVSGVSINIAGAVGLIDEAIAQASTTAALKDGVYAVKADADDKGNYAFVTVTIAGGKITSVVWDEVYNGSLKSVLSTTGQYVMKPVWQTQSESVGAYVVENQGTAGIMNENGYTDVVSGVSINIAGAVGLIDQAIAQANGKDGVYEVKADADANGNYAFVTLTVEGGKITSVVWDEVYNGSLKSVLSTTGQYVMKPVWQTQSESVGAYVVENQTTAGIMNENGYTDVVSGVSINIAGAVGLIDEAIAQASVTGEVPAPAPVTKPQVEATIVEVVSGATFTTKAVIRAIDEGYAWLLEYLK